MTISAGAITVRGRPLPPARASRPPCVLCGQRPGVTASNVPVEGEISLACPPCVAIWEKRTRWLMWDTQMTYDAARRQAWGELRERLSRPALEVPAVALSPWLPRPGASDAAVRRRAEESER